VEASSGGGPFQPLGEVPNVVGLVALESRDRGLDRIHLSGWGHSLPRQGGLKQHLEHLECSQQPQRPAKGAADGAAEQRAERGYIHTLTN